MGSPSARPTLLSGCFATPTVNTLVATATCTKTVVSGPVGGVPSFTTTTLPDETLTVTVKAPTWVDASLSKSVSDTFPISFTVAGFTAAGLIPAGTPTDPTFDAYETLTDPNAPDTTDLSTDPNVVQLGVGYQAPLPATPGDPMVFESSAGTPYPAALQLHNTTLGHTGYTPVVVGFGGIEASTTPVVSGGTKSFTTVLCQPSAVISSTSPSGLVTITPHVGS